MICVANKKKLFYISVTKYLIEVLFSNSDSPFHTHSDRSCWVRYIGTLNEHSLDQGNILRGSQ